MIQIKVHTFSLPLIRAFHGDGVVHLKKSSSLYPLLLSAPRILNNTSLNGTIYIDGRAQLLKSLHPESGHTLFRHHTDMLMRWMYAHMLKGMAPYSAMVEFYKIYDITEDDLPLGTAYKIWQRWPDKKKTNSHLFFSPESVHNYTNSLGDRREAILRHLAGAFQEYALDTLRHHPIPEDHMIRRFLIKALYDAGWTQSAIATSFDTSQQLVSYHISQR